MTKIQSAADHQLRGDASIELPAGLAGAEKVCEPIAEGSPNRIGPSATKQILVIDDDPLTREFVARTVTRAGFQADTAIDGEDGWEALRNATYDLVITDHEMPRLNGLKLIERIRSVSIEPPCMLISGNMPGIESVLAQLAGRGAVLAKPFSPAALIEKVYGLLLYGNMSEP